jgi:hypothetical protein
MQRMRLLSGSGAETKEASHATTAPAWEEEWREAEAVERLESDRESARRARAAVVWLVPAALVAGLLPALFPLTPGFPATDTLAVVIAAAVASAVAVGIVPLAIAAAGPRAALVFVVALMSAGAAAIHFAVAKPHFDEYTLFGVFFVGAGVAQLAWPVWLLLRPWRPLLALGALGNGLFVALWAVDRIWGLPIGPEHWMPEPVAFADSVTAAFELLLVADCLILLAQGRGRPLRTSLAVALALAVAALTALSLLSVLGVWSSFLTPAA